MKNAVSILFATLLFVTPFTFVNAEDNTKGTNTKEIYATPNDMILDFIQAKVDKIVQKEYGKRMSWGWVKIKNDKQIIEPNEHKRWYEIQTVIMVQDTNNKTGVKFDSMTFKFIPRENNNDSMDLRDTKFELLEYKHNDGKAY